MGINETRLQTIIPLQMKKNIVFISLIRLVKWMHIY